MSCGAVAILELSKRHDGYFCAVDDTCLDGLRLAGLVSITATCDGYAIVRAVPSESRPRPVTIGYRGNHLVHDDRGRWCAMPRGDVS